MPRILPVREILRSMMKQLASYFFIGGSVQVFALTRSVVARANSDALIANSLVTITFLSVSGSTQAITNPVSNYTGRMYKNAHERVKIGQVFWQGNLIALLVSFPAIPALYFAGKFWHDVFNYSDSISLLIDRFLFPVLFALPFFNAANISRSVLPSIGRDRFSIISSSLSLAVIIGTSCLFAMLPGENYGFPALGFPALIFTLFQNILNIGYLILSKTTRRAFHFFPCNAKESCSYFKILLKAGTASALIALGEFAGPVVGSVLAGRQGNQILAAKNIYESVFNVAVGLVAIPISQSMGILVAQEKDSLHNMLSIMKVGSAVVALISGVVLTLAISLSSHISGLFVLAETMEGGYIFSVAREMFSVAALTFPFDSARRSLTNILRSNDIHFVPAMFNLAGVTLTAPCLGWLLSEYAGLGATGYAVGALVGNALSSILLSIWFKRKRGVGQTREVQIVGDDSADGAASAVELVERAKSIDEEANVPRRRIEDAQPIMEERPPSYAARLFQSVKSLVSLGGIFTSCSRRRGGSIPEADMHAPRVFLTTRR